MGPGLKLPPYMHGFIDRHGKPRFYFRRTGFRQLPLPALPWSPEFITAYEMAMGGESAPRLEIGARPTQPGTITALVVTYYTSDEWRRLTIETQTPRRPLIERFR